MDSRDRRNRFGFGIGTFGRDLSYTLISMYLMFYLTDVIRVTGATLAAVTAVMVFARIFDAVSDPFIGVLVDNTRSRFGKFKPWIVGGALISSVLLVLLFTDFGLTGPAFVVAFLLIYLAWGIAFTSNDVAYWSMLPALSQSQQMREKIGSFARICASLGAFSMVVGIVPLSDALERATGSMPQAYTVLALGAVVIMLIFQSFTVFMAKEDSTIPTEFEPTRFRELARILFRNDQLLAVAVSMTLFMVGYSTTTSLGLYYFKYVYGDEAMYSVFALVLGVAQIGTLIAYPTLASRLSRKHLYSLGMILVTGGYTLFFFAPTSTMVFIGIAGLAMFVGQALIQMLILMFIADSVEYGQWKLGRRNESVTLSVQPFIYKVSAALSAGVVGATVLLSRTQDLPAGQTLEGGHLLIFKIAMMLLPLLLIAGSYLVYRRYYRIDATFFATMVQELHGRIKENER